MDNDAGTLPNPRPLAVEMCGCLFPRGMMLLRTHLQLAHRCPIQGENLALAREHLCRPTHAPQTRGVVPAERHPCGRLDLDCGDLSHVRTMAEALPGLRQARRHLLAVHQAIEKRRLVPHPERVEGERGELGTVNVCERH